MSTPNLSSLVNQLNSLCQHTLEQASNDCLNRTHSSVELEHWIIALLQANSDFRLLLIENNIAVDKLVDRLQLELERKAKALTDTPTLSIHLISTIKEAWYQATVEEGQAQIRSYHLLIAMLTSPSVSQILHLLMPKLTEITAEQIKLSANKLIEFDHEEGSSNTVDKDHTRSQASALAQYTVNLNAEALAGRIDPAIGRENEIRQMTDILLRRRQNNPILTGEPGVGKTAVVEGLALKISQDEVPTALKNTVIHALDIGLLMAGAGVKGEFEKRLKQLITEIKQSDQPIILFIDEAHTIIGAGNNSGSLDAANLLKPALARGELKTIAATTWSEYKKYFEQDAALTRRFQIVKIEEPDDETAIAMCHSIKTVMEQHHNVIILDQAIETAVKLSRRTIAERQLPDKAISLLDTACARVALEQQTQPSRLLQLNQLIAGKESQLISMQARSAIDPQKQSEKKLRSEIAALQKQQIQINRTWQQQKQKIAALHTAINAETKSDKDIKICRQKCERITDPLIHYAVDNNIIQQVISDWTGIPTERLNTSNYQTVAVLEQQLQHCIIGQEQAISQVTGQLKLYFAGLVAENKPIGVFLFTGPSGVGKTFMAQCLAEQLFGSKTHMTTINLSEFKEAHKTAMLFGAPAGYVGYGEGGVLTEAVRRQPYHLVLLDEIEKAHHSIHEVFYQIFDQGFAQDGQGRTIDFSNTLFVLTSNIGANSIIENKSVANDDSNEELTETVKQEMIDYFSPAFIGRLELVLFRALDQDNAKRIIQQQLEQIRRRIEDNQGRKVTFTDEIIEMILQQSQYQQTGARSFDQVIRQQVLPSMLEAMAR